MESTSRSCVLKGSLKREWSPSSSSTGLCHSAGTEMGLHLGGPKVLREGWSFWSKTVFLFGLRKGA